jgi:hypothetical protein
MKSIPLLALSLAIIGFGVTTGCGCSNIGGAPPGMSESDAKAAIEKMSPEDKIRAIASSPMPGKEKEARYLEIEKETGDKASDVLGSRPPAGTGAGN